MDDRASLRVLQRSIHGTLRRHPCLGDSEWLLRDEVPFTLPLSG